MPFISEAIKPGDEFCVTPAPSLCEPPLPAKFQWRGAELAVAEIVRTWRSTTTDRGDTYLARHWFDLRLIDGRAAVVYFDRKARRGSATWWLYTIASDA